MMLRPPLGLFSDPLDKSPVFVFGQENLAKAKRIIQEYADNFAQRRFFLPPLTSEYYLAVMSEVQFDELLENPSLARLNDPNIAFAIRKLKEEYAKMDEAQGKK